MLEKEVGKIEQQNEGFYQKTNYISWKGVYYLVSEKAVLTVNCTNKCNGDCFFCYNSMTFMKGDDCYLDKESQQVINAFKFAKRSGVKIVSYTGGEPTTDGERLLGLVELGKQYKFPILRLHTNGSGLLRKIKYKEKEDSLLNHLVNQGLNEISISLASHIKNENEKIMHLNVENTINEIYKKRWPDNLSIRLSCYVCKEGVYSVKQIHEYIAFGVNKGINRFIFRMSDDSQSETIQERMLRYVKSFLLRRFYLTFTHQKSDSYIYELSNGKIFITFSYAIEEVDTDRKIRRLLLMPDGVVYTSWIDQVSYLFKDDKKIFIEQCLNLSNNKNIKQIQYPSTKYWDKKKKNIGNVQSFYSIDIHIHSSVSDGIMSPCSVIDRLAQEGIREAVFTEHNCFHDNFYQLKEYAKERGVNLPFEGVEINTVYCKEDNVPLMKIHLLVYGNDLEKGKLAQYINSVNDNQNIYIKGLYNNLKRLGIIQKDFDQIFEIPDHVVHTKKKLYTRTPLAKEIVELTGLKESQAKEKYLSPIADEIRYKNWLDIHKIIRLAQEEGAVTIFAHPGWLRPFTKEMPTLTVRDLVSTIIDLKRWGLDGLEVVHRQNSIEMRNLLWNTALQLDMITTGGSDFHAKPKCILGTNGATENELQTICKLIEERSRV